MSRNSCDRADQYSPITRTASKPPPRAWLHSLRNWVTDRWNSSSGLCTGRVTQWSALPVVIASKIGRAVSHSPQ